MAAAVLSVAVAVSSLPRCLYYYDGRTDADGRQHSATKPSLSAATASGFLSPTVVVSTFLNLSQSPSTRIARQSLPLAKEGRIQDVRRPRDPKFDYLSHTALDDLSRNFNSSNDANNVTLALRLRHASMETGSVSVLETEGFRSLHPPLSSHFSKVAESNEVEARNGGNGYGTVCGRAITHVLKCK